MRPKQQAYDKPYVKTYLSPEEKQEVKDQAKSLNITTAELLRRLVLGKELPASEEG